MGIVTSARNGGAGTFAMQKLIEEARARGEKQMLLEVIEQNTAGVKLYQKVGFTIVRRLVGYQLENPQAESKDELNELDIREYAKLVSTDGIQDLPWQLSAETVALHTPPSRAFQLGDAFCVISNPDAVDVSIVSVLVKANSRRAGQGQRLMRAVFSRFPEKTWHVPALYPEEMSPFFESLGFKRESISQWQMVATL
jgi:ribosomal protein S18 acetylase RimI-like enzyme